MIPRLDHIDALPPLFINYFKDLRESEFSGDIEVSYAERLMAATDNSIYQMLPQGILFPKSDLDIKCVLKLAAKPEYQSITFSPRGGGTGTNGQSLNNGVVLDLSRHMNHVLEVNIEKGWARVQPGVVLDQLNEQVKGDGVFFAPDLSPSNRATIGGMVSTDACGKGSRIYGKTSNHIVELKLIFMDGTDWLSQKLDAETLELLCAGEGVLPKALSAVSTITRKKAKLIAEKFPKLTRFLSGYNLKMVWDEQGTFNLNYLIAGSEGSLCLISEIKLKLTPIPKAKVLIVAKYRDFSHSLRAAKTLLHSDPAAIETVDGKILGMARHDNIWHEVGAHFNGPQDHLVQSINLIEFVGDDEEATKNKALKLCKDLDDQMGLPDAALGYVLTEDEKQIKSLWALRKKGVGLLGNRPGSRRPVPFVEDTVVPPEKLADFIGRFRAILDGHGLEYGMFGHVDAGCLHVRPALDLQNPDDEALVRRITDEVKNLVLEYGGIIWGEHGKGLRSEFMQEFFGEELYEDLRTIKTAFDPDNRLNPGKICTPHNCDHGLIKLDEAPMRGQFDRQIKENLQKTFQLSLLCNGNGACFNYNPHDVMCPSYKLTRHRLHSPKGRAGLIREWARQLSRAGFNALDKSKKSALSIAAAQGDFSHEVLASMEGCLSCKACSSSCPIKVDIPDQKAQFLNHYYSRYKRPLKDKLLAFGEQTHAQLVSMPFIFNALIKIPGVSWFMKKFFGLVDTPALSSPDYRALLKKAGIPYMRSFHDLPKSLPDKSLIILPDAITCFYEAETFVEILKFFKNIGYKPIVAPFFINGKGLHVKGFLEEFRQAVKDAESKLEKLCAYQKPLIGIDPAITLTYREEYQRYGSGKPWNILLPQEWFMEHIKEIKPPSSDKTQSSVKLRLLGHCGEQSSRPQFAKEWQRLFAKFHINLENETVGCCGMAGAYGHEAAHYQDSKDIYAQSWETKLNEETSYVATGASCRSQVKRFSQRKLSHPLAWLNEHYFS